MSIPDYVYCPYCATPMEPRAILRQTRPACPACGFVHFLDPKVAVVAFITQGDRLLLIRRAVEPAKGKWALPGGYMDAGEQPETALRREVREEVGLDVHIERLLDIYPMEGPNERVRGIVLAYQVTPLGDNLDLVSDDDVSAAGWFGPDDLPGDLAFESTRRLLNDWKAQTRAE